MPQSKIALRSLFHSLGVAVYVSLISFILNHGQQWFGHDNRFLTPVAMLLLLVLSAGLTGSLVFAKPVLLYLDGRKSDSVKFLFWTFGWLLILTAFAFLGLTLLK